ncbi:hypothetical protein, partial [Corynebacterium ureicelerivorans]|uniref:hypothetical protein n=1 Tax=Corynebacterium ureicelerivorans TaxID=401472 RepID=UPI003C6C254C
LNRYPKVTTPLPTSRSQQRVACIHCLAVCHDLACFLRQNILRQNAIFYQADDSSLRLLIKILRHV